MAVHHEPPPTSLQASTEAKTEAKLYTPTFCMYLSFYLQSYVNVPCSYIFLNHIIPVSEFLLLFQYQTFNSNPNQLPNLKTCPRDTSCRS